MFQIEENTAFLEMRIKKYTLDGEYRGGSDAGFLQNLSSFIIAEINCPGGNSLIQFFEVCQTIGQSGEFSLFRPVRTAIGFSDSFPFYFGLDSNGHPFIVPGALVIAVRSHTGTEIARATRHAAVHEVVHKRFTDE